MVHAALLAALLSVAAVSVTPASSPDEFGPNAFVETFEGQLTVTVPQAYIPFDGGTLTYGVVPVNHPFLSGVVLVGHSAPPDAVWLFDWAVPYFYNQLFGLGSAGIVNSTTPLPSGSSFLGHYALAPTQGLGLGLPAPSYRVGCFVESHDSTPVTLRAFDVLGGVLGEHTIQPDGVAAGSGLDSFLGVHADAPIHRVELLGARCAVDDLMFDPDSARAFGAGCAGSGGFVPRLHVSGVASPGGAVGVEITDGLGGAVAFLMIGGAPANLPVGSGCALLAAPVGGIVPLLLGGAGAGAGALQLPAVLPPTAPLGSSTALQVWVADPAVPVGGAASNGVLVTVVP